jgi:hypothetical protein
MNMMAYQDVADFGLGGVLDVEHASLAPTLDQTDDSILHRLFAL